MRTPFSLDPEPIADSHLSTFFLERLSSLSSRHAAARTRHERTALAQAMFSIFLDCLDLGLEAEARALLASAPTAGMPAGHAAA